jgi:hypothetical protein
MRSNRSENSSGFFPQACGGGITVPLRQHGKVGQNGPEDTARSQPSGRRLCVC